MHEADSRGRRYPEVEHPYRGCYARDRDRIIHSRAFRRLEYKTQVFVNHEGDHYRTRLTHTLEVSQIGRTVARAMGLNEDLVEALALSHDLGHTPFGHLGEHVLQERLRDQGGFNHNHQSLRIVEHLEDPRPEYKGLNLSWEIREGIAKHSGPIDKASWPEALEYEPDRQPPLEAQMIDIVDEIAYNHHDLDDGLESGLLHIEDLVRELPLFGSLLGEARAQTPQASARHLEKRTLRRLIDRLVTDLIESSEARIKQSAVRTVGDVRNLADPLIGLGDEVGAQNRILKLFLRGNLYRHPRIERMMDKARRILHALFDRYENNPRLMPLDTQARIENDGLPSTIGDYIAGMTDRYAAEEYSRLFDPHTRV
jgi:dGTPase